MHPELALMLEELLAIQAQQVRNFEEFCVTVQCGAVQARVVRSTEARMQKMSYKLAVRDLEH